MVARTSPRFEAPPAYTVDLQDLHWAMHAIVKARPREQYDAMPLPTLPKAPALKEWSERPPPRSPSRRKEAASVPIFGAITKK